MVVWSGPCNRHVIISSVFRHSNRCRFSAFKSLPFPLRNALTFRGLLLLGGDSLPMPLFGIEWVAVRAANPCRGHAAYAPPRLRHQLAAASKSTQTGLASNRRIVIRCNTPQKPMQQAQAVSTATAKTTCDPLSPFSCAAIGSRGSDASMRRRLYIRGAERALRG